MKLNNTQIAIGFTATLSTAAFLISKISDHTIKNTEAVDPTLRLLAYSAIGVYLMYCLFKESKKILDKINPDIAPPPQSELQNSLNIA